MCRLSAAEKALRARPVQERALSEANASLEKAGKPRLEFVAAVEKDEKALILQRYFPSSITVIMQTFEDYEPSSLVSI